MIRHWLRALKTRSEGLVESARLRRRGRHWAPEKLEDGVLLASPTAYTVDMTSDIGKGAGTTGDLLYVIREAIANTNPAGSLIQFDPDVFNTAAPKTITLFNTLVLT
jgi:hypothetical protein